MENIKQHKARWQAIPEEKRTSKVRSSIVGVFAIALGIALELLFPELPDLLLMGLVGYGFFSISGDMVRSFVGFVPAAIRDIRRAIKGNGSNDT